MNAKPLLPLLVGLLAAGLQAKVDLVTLPKRDAVQLTIYNSADLTLARDSRVLTLRQGLNQMQFSWAGTLIDPTSLEMLPKADGERIEVLDLDYPPRVRELGLWNIRSGLSGTVPVEISYLTSGLSWRAFYMGTLSADETTMALEGFVRVTNQSGEDYDNAQVRLVVGTVHLLDEIAALARREQAYGAPQGTPPPVKAPSRREGAMRAMKALEAQPMCEGGSLDKPKDIRKEGLSEYFLYTIAGTESIPDGGSKRLPSFQAGSVPVTHLFKYEEERHGKAVIRFLRFANDQEHALGQTPIPGGQLRVFRLADEARHLSYEGRSEFKYIPLGDKVELSLGPARGVSVTPRLMDTATDRYIFDHGGNPAGWDEIQTWTIEVKNTRTTPAKVEITRNFPSQAWDLAPPQGEGVAYEKKDVTSGRFTLDLPPRTSREFTYVLTIRHGRRAE